jgi:hypothetical protein
MRNETNLMALTSFPKCTNTSSDASDKLSPV